MTSNELIKGNNQLEQEQRNDAKSTNHDKGNIKRWTYQQIELKDELQLGREPCCRGKSGNHPTLSSQLFPAIRW
jgi:hypothetical protein